MFATVPYTGMVDEFQKKYDALSVPYPKADSELSSLDAEEKTMRADHEKLVAESKARIAEVNKEVEAWKRMPCPTTMSLEEMCAYGLGGPGGYCTDFKHEEVAFWPYDKDVMDYRKKLQEMVDAGVFDIDNEKEYEEMKKVEAAAKKS